MTVGCSSPEARPAFKEELSVLSGTGNYLESAPPLYSAYKTHTKAKGIYVSGFTAGTGKIDGLIQLTRGTELNAFVIDVKNDDGTVSFPGIPASDESGAATDRIPDIKGLMEKLYANGIYPIARIVAFKDPYLPEARPDLAVKNPDGSICRDRTGAAWVNPYNKEVWDYVADIAAGAAKAGFKEIQFDYIRFSDEKAVSSGDYGDTEKTREEIIAEFTAYAADKLEGYNVEVSADVFGAVITSPVDSAAIGQDYTAMADALDVICPMVYPSHYAEGSFGVKYPDLGPYEIISGAMAASAGRLSENKDVAVRPWLQAFTASWITPHGVYGADEVRKQIEACRDAGVDEWLLWNPSNTYAREYFLPREGGENDRHR